MNASEVYPQLFVGACPDASDPELRKFGLLVFTLPIVFAAREAFPVLSFTAALTDDAWQIVKGDHERALTAVNAVEGAYKRSLGAPPALVVCREGMNRSAWVAAQAIRRLCGCSGEDALAQVQAARPGSLYNIHFQRHLKSLPAEPLA